MLLWSDLYYYSDVYLVVKETIDLGDVGNNAMTKNIVVFKKNAPITLCISKINNTFIGNT